MTHVVQHDHGRLEGHANGKLRLTRPSDAVEQEARRMEMRTEAKPLPKRPAAQRFINQGLNLAYAFNPAEARRAFREAALLSS